MKLNLRKVRNLFSLVILLSVISPLTIATPIIWYLQEANFNSGGSASGSFMYDADLNLYSNINLITTPDAIREGNTFNFVNTTSPGDATTLISLTGDAITGSIELALGFAAPLTNAGGTIDIAPYPTGFTVEGICNNDCSGINAPFRFLNSGFVSTTLFDNTDANVVPEPSAVTLFGIGCIVIALYRRRKHISVNI
ncbi:PEP-CTERM sorting domain-containing protein [Neptunicella sp.]|uniref:PEP-CTERM sorting domain-containing protein n=1 Tax=Neptunicella sp. TaxID=2125986 RepID=UPI003F6934A9